MAAGGNGSLVDVNELYKKWFALVACVTMTIMEIERIAFLTELDLKNSTMSIRRVFYFSQPMSGMVYVYDRSVEINCTNCD